MFDLTPQERRALLFLAAIILIGSGLDFALKKNPGLRGPLELNSNIGMVNLNQADADMLISLPGIGPKLAQRIIDYRQDHGIFRDVEELQNIKGITSGRLQKIKGLLYTGD